MTRKQSISLFLRSLPRSAFISFLCSFVKYREVFLFGTNYIQSWTFFVAKLCQFDIKRSRLTQTYALEIYATPWGSSVVHLQLAAASKLPKSAIPPSNAQGANCGGNWEHPSVHYLCALLEKNFSIAASCFFCFWFAMYKCPPQCQ